MSAKAASTKATVAEILSVLQAGFFPYEGDIHGSVYERLGCPNRARSAWLVKGSLRLCLGCSRRCATTSPEGFQARIPYGRRNKHMVFGSLPSISAQDLLDKTVVMTVATASFVVDLSSSELRNMVDEGRFRAVDNGAKPLRLYTEELREYLAGER